MISTPWKQYIKCWIFFIPAVSMGGLISFPLWALLLASIPATLTAAVSDSSYLEVFDDEFNSEPLTGKTDFDSVENRKLTLRWNYNTGLPIYDWHVYVKKGDGGFFYLGHTGDGSARMFTWSNPDFNTQYQFRVWGLYKNDLGQLRLVYIDQAGPMGYNLTGGAAVHLKKLANPIELASETAVVTDDLLSNFDLSYFQDHDTALERALALKWNPGSGTFANTHIYISINGDQYSFLGQTGGGGMYYFRFDDAETFSISDAWKSGPQSLVTYWFRVIALRDDGSNVTMDAGPVTFFIDADTSPTRKPTFIIPNTPTSSLTVSPTPTPTRTFSPTAISSFTGLPTLIASPTYTFTPTATRTPTATPSFTPTPSPTNTPTVKPSPTMYIPPSGVEEIVFYNPFIQYGAKPLTLVWIAPGSFQMGSPENEQDRNEDESPQHKVTLSRGFYIGKYEITQSQWKAIMEINPSGHIGNNFPVEQINWYDAIRFCNRLSRILKRDLVYNEENWQIESDFLNGFRLPTEAEWEYACRSGNAKRFAWGDDPKYTDTVSYGWYRANSDYESHEVGNLVPNNWGLFDMNGNVWEWCYDWYGNYLAESQTDPAGSSTGNYRVVRGGGWNSLPQLLRSAQRLRNDPNIGKPFLGLRVLTYKKE